MSLPMGSTRSASLRALTMVAMLAMGVSSGSSADSVFSSIGYGRWVHTVDVRSAAMGDVSVVAASQWSFGPRNPSLAARQSEPAIYFSVDADFTRVDAGLDTQTRPDARLPLVGIGLPIAGGVVGRLALYDLNDPRYEISQNIPGQDGVESDPGYTLVSRGEGAWSQVALTLARRIGDGALGAQIGLPIGTFSESTLRDFSASGFSDRRERTEIALEDLALITVGGEYEIGPAGVGAFFRFPTEGDVVTKQDIRGEEEATLRSAYRIKLPASLGAGASFQVTDRLLVSGEWRHEDWESTEINGVNWLGMRDELDLVRGFKNVDAWGAGLEWRRGREEQRSAWKRLRLRAGYSYQPWPTAGPELGRITDRSVTTGVGVPFVAGNGELGLALRYTQRRESGSDVKENIISFVFGMTFARQPRAY